MNLTATSLPRHRTHIHKPHPMNKLQIYGRICTFQMPRHGNVARKVLRLLLLLFSPRDNLLFYSWPAGQDYKNKWTKYLPLSNQYVSPVQDIFHSSKRREAGEEGVRLANIFHDFNKSQDFHFGHSVRCGHTAGNNIILRILIKRNLLR